MVTLTQISQILEAALSDHSPVIVSSDLGIASRRPQTVASVHIALPPPPQSKAQLRVHISTYLVAIPAIHFMAGKVLT